MRPVIPFILYFIGIIAIVCWAQNCEYDCIPGIENYYYWKLSEIFKNNYNSAQKKSLN